MITVATNTIICLQLPKGPTSEIKEKDGRMESHSLNFMLVRPRVSFATSHS